MREHPATEDEFAVMISNARCVSSSQISEYVDGKVENQMGETFCSADSLRVMTKYLSLEPEEEIG